MTRSTRPPAILVTFYHSVHCVIYYCTLHWESMPVLGRYYSKSKHLKISSPTWFHVRSWREHEEARQKECDVERRRQDEWTSRGYSECHHRHKCCGCFGSETHTVMLGDDERRHTDRLVVDNGRSRLLTKTITKLGIIGRIARSSGNACWP